MFKTSEGISINSKMTCIDEVRYSFPAGKKYEFQECVKTGGLLGPTSRKYTEAELLLSMPQRLVVEVPEWAGKKRLGKKIKRDSFRKLVPLVSKRLKKIIEELDPGIHQFIKVEFESTEGKPVWVQPEFYWLIVGRLYAPTEMWKEPFEQEGVTILEVSNPIDDLRHVVQINYPWKLSVADDFRTDANLWYVPTCVRNGILYQNFSDHLLCTSKFEDRLYDLYMKSSDWILPGECDFLRFGNACRAEINARQTDTQ